MQAYEKLEEELATHFACKNVVACSSGTAALHLALEAFQITPNVGCEVIIPDYTMIAVARAVTLAGLVPVFADCKHDLTIDPESVSKLINRKTRAVIAVHTYGRSCDMKALHTLCAPRDLHLVEDNAEAHGLQKSVYAHATCWSFYKNKAIAGEEGGAVSFPYLTHAVTAKKLRCLGFDENHDYRHIPRGHNYRMSNCHAEMILRSLYRWHFTCRWRQEAYTEWSRLCPSSWQLYKLSEVSVAPWVFPIVIGGSDFAKHVSRDVVMADVVRKFQKLGIPARYGFYPMSEQPEYWTYSAPNSGEEGSTPNAHRYSEQVMYLPLLPSEKMYEIEKEIERTTGEKGNLTGRIERIFKETQERLQRAAAESIG